MLESYKVVTFDEMMALKFYRKRSLYFTIHVMHIKNNLQYKVLTITLSLYLHYTSCNMIIIVHGLRLNSRIDHDDFHSDGLIAMNLKDKLLQYSIEKRHSALATLWAWVCEQLPNLASQRHALAISWPWIHQMLANLASRRHALAISWPWLYPDFIKCWPAL